MKWSKHRKTEVLIHSPLNCQPLNHLSGAEGWYLPSAPEQPTLTLLSALILSPALLLTGLDGLTGRHGCCEMWWQWALRSVFIDILDGRLYFPYNLFKTKKNAQNLFNLIFGCIETSANFAGRYCLVGAYIKDHRMLLLLYICPYFWGPTAVPRYFGGTAVSQ